jgi:hypothetical protein
MMTFLDKNRLKKPNAGKPADPDTSDSDDESDDDSKEKKVQSTPEVSPATAPALDDVSASVATTADLQQSDLSQPLGPFDKLPTGLAKLL